MSYIVEFTSGDKSERILETTDRAAAIATAEQEQIKRGEAGQKGIISLYEVTTERGQPMRKCYDFWEV